MSGFPTLKRAHRNGVFRSRRKFSTTSPSKLSVASHSSPVDIPSNHHIIANVISSLPSEKLLRGLSSDYKHSVHTFRLGKKDQVKTEIARLLREKSFDALLATVTKWTSPASNLSWDSVLSQRELAYIIWHLVDYQKNMLLKASSAKMIGQTETESQMAHVREIREHIRAIYANLLTKSGSEVLHLYAKDNGFFDPPKSGSSAHFRLSASDYENLIELELNNGKLDLASRWFQHIEAQMEAQTETQRGVQGEGQREGQKEGQGTVESGLQNGVQNQATKPLQAETRPALGSQIEKETTSDENSHSKHHQHGHSVSSTIRKLQMTQKLWLLRFRVYANAQSSLWRVERSPLNDTIVDPRQSSFKHEKKWLDLFNEYSSSQALQAAAGGGFDNDLVTVMLSSIAYGQNVTQAAKLIEVNWGIGENGELVSGFERPEPSDPLFPDLDVLSTIVVGMLFNKKYVASMAYINAFQAHYGISVSGPQSKNFWDQTFRWAEIATRFSEARAFQYFMNETGSSAFAGSQLGLSDEYPLLLEEAKKSADFDYERFLAFVSDLRRQRHGLLGELWKCFHESKPGFTARPYRTYLHVAEELLQTSGVSSIAENERVCSDLCYEILTHLCAEHDANSVSPDSFNAPMVASTVGKIRTLYLQTMQVLVNAKGSAGRLGEIPFIASKWSLDEAMEQEVRAWAQRNESRYLQRMVDLEQERLKEEENDTLLDLM